MEEMFFSSIKRQRSVDISNSFDLLSDEIVFTILDFLDPNPSDKKSFSLVCKSFYAIESKHRKALKPLRPELLPSILKRYPNVTDIDLSLCRRITDDDMNVISDSCNSSLLRIDLSRSGFFSGTGMLSLALNCENLVELDLSNATELRDSAAAAIGEAKNLEKLWLARCKLVTDMGIRCIAVGCRKLRLISLKWCFSVGDLGVGLIAVNCQEIRSLDLSHLPITDKCLPSILKLKYLNELSLQGCFGIDDQRLSLLEVGCRSLKKLDMSSCHKITHVGLSFLTSGIEYVEQLSLAYGSKVTLAHANILGQLSKLQSVKLDGCLVTSAGLKAIGNWCISLKELSLSTCPGVTDEGLSLLLSKHKDLRKLDLTCCRTITDVSVAQIANSCTLLTSLRMESCSLVSAKAFISIGRRCHALEELDLTENEITDEALKSISQCSKLSILKLGLCLDISDEGLDHIGRCCSKLVELDLYRLDGITDSSLIPIARGCPRLEMINIAYCKNITDPSLSALSKCSKLHTIEARGCPLITSLGLTDIGVGCKQLTKLDVKSCCQIDDAGMIGLAQFSQNLRQINLSFTSVTEAGLLSLANLSCLQNFTILHTKGLTPSGLATCLLTWGGLMKAKLHISFKSHLSRPLLDYLEARGCVLQWRDKSFKAEVDPKSWKLRLEDMAAIA